MENDLETIAYRLIGDMCNLSEKTIRNAFARKPVTWQTACKICRHLNLATTHCFKIKPDNRGRNKKTRKAS